MSEKFYKVELIRYATVYVRVHGDDAEDDPVGVAEEHIGGAAEYYVDDAYEVAGDDEYELEANIHRIGEEQFRMEADYQKRCVERRQQRRRSA